MPYFVEVDPQSLEGPCTLWLGSSSLGPDRLQLRDRSEEGCVDGYTVLLRLLGRIGHVLVLSYVRNQKSYSFNQYEAEKYIITSD